MSRRILLEAKRRVEHRPPLNPQRKFEGTATARIAGPDVVVDDETTIVHFLNEGYFGSILGQRLNFTNGVCFPTPVDDNEADSYVWHKDVNSKLMTGWTPSLVEPPTSLEFGLLPNGLPSSADPPLFTSPGDQWLKMVNAKSQRRLFLSPQEAIYLVKNCRLQIEGHSLSSLWIFYRQNDFWFERRYFVYEYFRDHGWTVRPALTFGGDFSLYKESPEAYHSSVIVQIVDDVKTVDPLLLAAMKRHVKNVKKAVYLVVVHLPDGQTWDSVNAESTVEIRVFQHSVSVPSKSLT